MKKGILFLLGFVILLSCVSCDTSSGGGYTPPKFTVNKPSETPGTSSPISTAKPMNSLKTGFYAFYNEAAKGYLSCSDYTLSLSTSSFKWKLNKNKGVYSVYAGESDLLLDIDNAYIAEGTTIKVWQFTGHAAQTWNIQENNNGTYSLLSTIDPTYCLGFSNGKAELQKRNTNNPAQEWKVISKTEEVYISISGARGIIELQLPLDITNVITKERLQQWANDLETAYDTYYALTNYKPYETIIVEAYKPCQYLGYVLNDSNIIHMDDTFIREDLAKMAVRKDDWNFGVLHEMGHMFDNHRPWLFEAEVMTDLKVAYVLEMNNVVAAPSEFDASYNFRGKNIIQAYQQLGGGFSKNYDVYSFAQRFLEIKEVIGWEPFKQTFHTMQTYSDYYAGLTKKEKFETFIGYLSQYSNQNVAAYFSYEEWNTILNKIA